MSRRLVDPPVETVPLVPRALLNCLHCGASWPNLLQREDTEQHCLLCGWSGWSKPPRDQSAFEVLTSGQHGLELVMHSRARRGRAKSRLFVWNRI